MSRPMHSYDVDMEFTPLDEALYRAVKSIVEACIHGDDYELTCTDFCWRAEFKDSHRIGIWMLCRLARRVQNVEGRIVCAVENEDGDGLPLYELYEIRDGSLMLRYGHVVKEERKHSISLDDWEELSSGPNLKLPPRESG